MVKYKFVVLKVLLQVCTKLRISILICVNTCTFVCMCVLPGGIDITIVKHIKKSRVLAAEQRALKIKEGTGGKRQVEGNYIYRD